MPFKNTFRFYENCPILLKLRFKFKYLIFEFFNCKIASANFYRSPFFYKFPKEFYLKPNVRLEIYFALAIYWKKYPNDSKFLDTSPILFFFNPIFNLFIFVYYNKLAI